LRGLWADQPELGLMFSVWDRLFGTA